MLTMIIDMAEYTSHSLYRHAFQEKRLHQSGETKEEEHVKIEKRLIPDTDSIRPIMVRCTFPINSPSHAVVYLKTSVPEEDLATVRPLKYFTPSHNGWRWSDAWHSEALALPEQKASTTTPWVVRKSIDIRRATTGTTIDCPDNPACHQGSSHAEWMGETSNIGLGRTETVTHSRTWGGFCRPESFETSAPPRGQLVLSIKIQLDTTPSTCSYQEPDSIRLDGYEQERCG